MKVKKISLNKSEIRDIILCPKINLYLQSPVCHRCAYFISDEENHISCSYKKSQIKNVDQKKEELKHIKTYLGYDLKEMKQSFKLFEQMFFYADELEALKKIIQDKMFRDR